MLRGSSGFGSVKKLKFISVKTSAIYYLILLITDKLYKVKKVILEIKKLG